MKTFDEYIDLLINEDAQITLANDITAQSLKHVIKLLQQHGVHIRKKTLQRLIGSALETSLLFCLRLKDKKIPSAF